MDKKNKKEQISEKIDAKAEKISTTKKNKKSVKKNITTGIASVYATFNNTIITISDDSGNVIAWSSAGSKGFKILSIKDTTPMPHNGSRPPKKRRV